MRSLFSSKKSPWRGYQGQNGSSVDGSNCLLMDRAKEDLADPIINTTLWHVKMFFKKNVVLVRLDKKYNLYPCP